MAITRSCQFWFRVPRDLGERLTVLLWAIAALTLGVGVLSLVSPSHVREVLEPWLNIHVLFSLLLVCFCLMRTFARRQLAPLRALDIGEFSRVLSRTVYVFIYAVIGLRQISSIARHILYGGSMDFNLAQEAQRGPDVVGFDLHNDFQAFIASGLVVLVFVRMLMYWIWLRTSGARSVIISCTPHPSNTPTVLK